jgi:predicted Holliday junction resolvase-like endonuclease
MNPAPLLSIVSGLLCLLLSFVFYFKSSNVQSLSADLQKQQTELQSQQQTLQTEQNKFQNQQQQIQAGLKLAQEVGPQVLNDLGLLARDNKNEKIRKLLEKYGVTLNEKTGEAPKTAPAAPKPAEAPKLQ